MAGQSSVGAMAMVRVLLALVAWTVETALLGPILVVSAYTRPSQRLASFAAWIWAEIFVCFSGMRLTVAGRSRLLPGKPYFIVSNHQSALDIPVILTILSGGCRFMAKDSLMRLPLFGFLIARNGVVPVDRTNVRATKRSLDAMIESLQLNPISFAVFPEGTRSVTGRLLPFRRGTMKICQRSGLPVVPLAIDGTRTVHKRGTWRFCPGDVRVTVCAPIPLEEVQALSTRALHDRVRNAIARALQASASTSIDASPCPGVVEEL